MAADDESKYVERQVTNGGTDELWRRYLDGRVPARIAVTRGPFSTFVVGEASVKKLWLQVARTDPAESLRREHPG